MSLLCFNQAVDELQSGSPSTGFRLLRELADEGYEPSQLYVGCAYLLGHIQLSKTKKFKVKKDMKKAITYLYNCAKQGNQDALHNLKELRKNVALDDYVSQARAEIPTERIV
jgi:TPR repeat protein